MTRSQRRTVEETAADLPDTDVLLKRATLLAMEVERLAYELHLQLDEEHRTEGEHPDE